MISLCNCTTSLWSCARNIIIIYRRKMWRWPPLATTERTRGIHPFSCRMYISISFTLSLFQLVLFTDKHGPPNKVVPDAERSDFAAAKQIGGDSVVTSRAPAYSATTYSSKRKLERSLQRYTAPGFIAFCKCQLQCCWYWSRKSLKRVGCRTHGRTQSCRSAHSGYEVCFAS